MSAAKKKVTAETGDPNDILFTRLYEGAIAPTKPYDDDDAGWDLYAAEPAMLSIFDVVKVPTGIAVAIPKGCRGSLEERSGLASKGVALRGRNIESTYRGEIFVMMHNLGNSVIHVSKGDRIAQLVVSRMHPGRMREVEKLPESLRGSNGFGSSGK